MEESIFSGRTQWNYSREEVGVLEAHKEGFNLGFATCKSGGWEERGHVKVVEDLTVKEDYGQALEGRQLSEGFNFFRLWGVLGSCWA